MRTANGARIVIIGAGLTGLGAGHRLHELGHDDWVILEATGTVGGLAASHTDAAGFTYDIGGHVVFTRDPYVQELFDELLADGYREIERDACVYVHGRHVPYPFQDNLRHLDPDVVLECVQGLMRRRPPAATGAPFSDWLQATFGAGICRHFTVPYNRKLWATPLDAMTSGWIADRVKVVDVDAVLRNVILGEDRTSWAPTAHSGIPFGAAPATSPSDWPHRWRRGSSGRRPWWTWIPAAERPGRRTAVDGPTTFSSAPSRCRRCWA